MKRYINKRYISRGIILFSVCFFFAGIQGVAQETYLLKELRIPQVAQENPGAVIPYDAHVSFPFAGRAQAGGNLPFYLGDLFTISDKMFNKLAKNNTTRGWVEDDILNFGFRNGKNYFSFISTFKTDASLTFKKDFLALLVEGNDISKNEKLTLIGNDFISLNSYLEFGFGYNREINDKVSFGFNVKYLNGLANAYTTKTDLTLTTGENYHELILNHSIDGKLACIYDIFDVSDVIKDSTKNLWDDVIKRTQLSDFKNHGFSFDLGARYKINDVFELSAAVLDIGFINWKSNAYQYKVADKSFTLRGYTSEENIFSDSTKTILDRITAYYKQIGDSLLNDFTSEAEQSSSYIKWLNTRFFVSAAIYASPKDRFNLTFRGIFVNGVFVPSGSVSYTRNVGKWFDVVVGNTFKQNALLNPGLGVNFTAKVFQLYVLVDYTNTLAYIDRAKNLNVVSGINFVAPLKKDSFKASYIY